MRKQNAIQGIFLVLLLPLKRSAS